MIDEEKIKEACTEIIVASYRDNFQREISEEEIAEVFKHLIPRMEDELKNLKGFSDSEFSYYMKSKRNELLFSPANVIGEVRRVLTEFGLESLLHAGKYKRLREMEIAARFCLANYKNLGEMLMILPQDNPDIILVRMGNKEGKNIEASRLEIMSIPEVVKGELNDNLPEAIANFIKEKKFTKDYGTACSLVVCLDFNQQSLNCDLISASIQKIKDNPYVGIWLTFTSSEDGKNMSVLQVFPSFVRVDYNFEKELNLLY
jgi:hypothetical protein